MSSAEFVVIVPVRLGSVRLPRKALADINGEPMLVHVLRRAAASGAEQVIAAVDDAELEDAATAAGFRAVRTGVHDSGSSRVAEAAAHLELPDDAIVVNVQGDEPFMEPELIRQTAALLAAQSQYVCATVARPFRDHAEWQNPAIVKVVTAANGEALYFSRAAIPHRRDEQGEHGRQIARAHLGLYAYRAAFLQRLPSLPAAAIEQCEQLEQLRILWHGERMPVLFGHSDSFGIDTAEDLARAAGAPPGNEHPSIWSQ